MNRTQTTIAAGAIFLIVVASLAFYVSTGNQRAAQAVAEEFALRMQNVSLLEENASSTMRSEYGSFVTSALLAEWQANPEEAPGRQTSSPWPDHLEIDRMEPQGAGFIINGRFVMMTSTGEAEDVPVVMQIIPEGGKWVIAAYAEHR